MTIAENNDLQGETLIQELHRVMSEKEHWENICKLLMHKLGKVETKITAAEAHDFGVRWKDGCVLLTQGAEDHMVLKLLTLEEARKLANAN